MSALASPRTFIWSRLTDAALSFPDQDAMEINARVERWTLDEIAPLASVQPFVDQLPKATARLIRTPREVGVSFQHLAALVGRQARAKIWPELMSWLKSPN